MESHKIAGYELMVDRQVVAGSEVYSLEVRVRSSLDFSSVVLNLTAAEFGEIVRFLADFKGSPG